MVNVGLMMVFGRPEFAPDSFDMASAGPVTAPLPVAPSVGPSGATSSEPSIASQC